MVNVRNKKEEETTFAWEITATFIEKRAFDMGFKRLIGFIRPRRQGRKSGEEVFQAEEEA